MDRNALPTTTPPSPERGRTLQTFAVGLLVRLAGLALIALGDGHDAWWAKGLVIVGVAISVLGIGVLRYLLVAPLLKNLRMRHNHTHR